MDLISELAGPFPHLAARIFLLIDPEQLFLDCNRICKAWHAFLKSDFFFEQFLLHQFGFEKTRRFFKSFASKSRAVTELRLTLASDKLVRPKAKIAGKDHLIELNNQDGTPVLDIANVPRFVEAVSKIRQQIASREVVTAKPKSDEKYNHFYLVDLHANGRGPLIEHLRMPIRVVADLVEDGEGNEIAQPALLLNSEFEIIYETTHNHDLNACPWTFFTDYPSTTKYLAFFSDEETDVRLVFPTYLHRLQRVVQLLIAAHCGDSSLIDDLLRADPYDKNIVNYAEDGGHTALMECILDGDSHVEAVQTLLRWGASIHTFLDETPRSDHMDMITHASINGNFETITVMVDHDIKSGRKVLTPEVLNNSLSYAHIHQFACEIAIQLTGYGADVNYVTENERRGDSETLLMAALSYGRRDYARTLLDLGIDGNFVSRQGRCALTVVTTTRYLTASFVTPEQAIATAKVLLRSGKVDVNIRTGPSRNSTPLIDALVANNLQAVKLLLKHGADPSLADGNGCTAKQIAESVTGPGSELARLFR